VDFSYKIIDLDGTIHKIKSSADSITALRSAISEQINKPLDAFAMKYVDEDKDEITLSSDASLRDAGMNI
jgi:hypothetical protein